MFLVGTVGEIIAICQVQLLVFTATVLNSINTLTLQPHYDNKTHLAMGDHYQACVIVFAKLQDQDAARVGPACATQSSRSAQWLPEVVSRSVHEMSSLPVVSSNDVQCTAHSNAILFCQCLYRSMWLQSKAATFLRPYPKCVGRNYPLGSLRIS